MGLAPNIPLSGIPTPQPQGPLDMAQKGLNVQALINAVQRQKTEEATAQLQQQQEQIKTQQMQQQQQDLNTLRDLAPKYAKKDPATGIGTFDLEGLANEAQSRGVNPSTINELRKQNYALIEQKAKAGTESLANETAHNKAMYEVYEGVKGINDPDERQTAWNTGKNRLQILGADVSHLPATAPDDKGLSQYEVPLAMNGQHLADAKTLAETNKANAEAAEKEWQKFPELGVMVNTKNGEQRSVAGGPVTPPAMLESKWMAIQQKKNLGQPVSAEESAFSKSYQQYKEMVPQFNFNLSGGATGGMTPQAIDAQAEKYFQTGQLPPAGRGPAGIAFQRQIMQRANDLHPGESLAASSGVYKANAKSLAELQPKLDQVNAFENTALKNLDLFTGLAQKAIDSGLPIVNAPLRAAASMLGGQDQAAFNAARQVAVNEIAKVTSSPGLSGQLSDNARHEVENFIPATATVGQIMRVSSVLKQDMENRRMSYQEQIGDIQKRLGGQPPAGGATSARKTLTSAQIAQAAKDHNVSVEEATRQARAAGYEVKP